METVGNIVDNVLEARGWRGKVLEQMAVELWPEVVGDTIAQNTLAEKYKNGTLYVRARSPLWTQELHFHQARIIARLNGRLKRNLVQKIRCFVTPPRGIKVGTLKPNWEDPTFPVSVNSLPASKTIENDAAIQHARTLCSHIEDLEMRTTMENLIAASLRARQALMDAEVAKNAEVPNVKKSKTP